MSETTTHETTTGQYTAQDRANEGCCWNYVRQLCRGGGCLCDCHATTEQILLADRAKWRRQSGDLESENARLRERVAALEAALERGRDFIARTIEAVTPEPCRCAPVEFCGECLAIKTLEQALDALAGEGQGA